MIEVGPEMPEERFLALILGRELYGWNTDNLPSQAVDAAIDARPDLVRAAKRLAETVRLRDKVKRGGRDVRELLDGAKAIHDG